MIQVNEGMYVPLPSHLFVLCILMEASESLSVARAESSARFTPKMLQDLGLKVTHFLQPETLFSLGSRQIQTFSCRM
jgi:hypothetical protein